jgi:hypothetical protein
MGGIADWNAPYLPLFPSAAAMLVWRRSVSLSAAASTEMDSYGCAGG